MRRSLVHSESYCDLHDSFYNGNRHTPPLFVPANSAVLLAARDSAWGAAGCVASGFHVRPPSVERNTPSPSVPARKIEPLAVSEWMNEVESGVVAAAQW